MANISKIKLPNGNTYDIVPNAKELYHGYANPAARIQANQWQYETTSTNIPPGIYIVTAYFRATLPSAGIINCNLVNSNNSRLSYSTSSSSYGSGNITTGFTTILYVTSTITNFKFAYMSSVTTSGTYLEFEFSVIKIGNID